LLVFFASTEKVSFRVERKKKARNRVKTGTNWLCRFLYRGWQMGSFEIK